MYPSVYKFLMLNHHVAIPGVGNFFFEKKSASFDFINKVFHPPVNKISFSVGALAAEKKFYSFLSMEKNVNEIEAIQLFNEFAFNLRNNIKNEYSVELPGLGTLQKGDDGIFSFIPIPLANRYLLDVTASPIIGSTSQEHFITVGNDQRSSKHQVQEYLEDEVDGQVSDRWWIIALILAIAGISAIIYYYYKNGGLS